MFIVFNHNQIIKWETPHAFTIFIYLVKMIEGFIKIRTLPRKAKEKNKIHTNIIVKISTINNRYI